MADVAFCLDTAGVVEAVEPLASALSSGDSDRFLRAIPKNVANREELGANVRALLTSAEVTCSVAVSSIDGDMAQVDWYMELRTKSTQTVAERRRGTVRVRVGSGKLLSIDPVGFFRPPQ